MSAMTAIANPPTPASLVAAQMPAVDESLAGIGLEEVRRLFGGRSRASVYRDIATGTLPAPFHVGRQALWVRGEVQAILRARMVGATDDDVRGLVVRLKAARHE